MSPAVTEIPISAAREERESKKRVPESTDETSPYREETEAIHSPMPERLNLSSSARGERKSGPSPSAARATTPDLAFPACAPDRRETDAEAVARMVPMLQCCIVGRDKTDQ